MKEKLGESVMECTDFMVLVCLLMACGTTLVFADRRHELNGKCQLVSHCNRVGYFCGRNGTCQCGSGYTPNVEWKKCVGFIGSKCTYDSQCVEGAYCTGVEGREVCRCREQDDYFPSEDKRSCISAAWALHQKHSAMLILLTIFWTSSYLNT